jgi:hypothetical protein
MLSQRVALAFFALVIPVSLWVRLYGLDQIGVGGSDTILYYSLAEAWARGEAVYRIGDSIEVFRPVLLAFNGLSLKLFGHVDYAIKLANTLVDIVNLALIAALAWTISNRRSVLIASVATYAFLPMAIWSARQELPHTLSTFFVLLACLLVFRGIREKLILRALWLMAGGGMALAAAVFVHQELVFIALPLALSTLVGMRIAGPESRGQLFAALAAFSLFPLLASLLVLGHESVRIASTVETSANGMVTSLGFYPEKFSRYLWNGVGGASSAVFAISCAVCCVYYAITAWFRRDVDVAYLEGAGFCFIVPLIFIALYAVFFGTIFPRGVLPLMPLLIIAVYFSLANFFQGRAVGIHAVVCSILVVVYSVSSLASFTAFKAGNRRFGKEWAQPDLPTARLLKRGYGEFLIDAKYAASYATHWRKVYEVFQDRVDANNRLLVVPSTVFYAAGRRALQTDVYLGDNAVYRLDHVDQSLDGLLEEKNIRFVLFTVGQQRSPPTRQRPYRYQHQWGESREIDLAEAYGLREYSAQAEYQQIAKAMQRLGARQLFPFPEGSFESRVARVWQLP